MKVRLLLALALSAATAFSVAADEQVRRTVIIKDGKIVTDEIDGDPLRLTDEIFGGKRAWLGVSLTDLTPELREHFGSGDTGVMVGSIAAGSPAAKAGVRVGDIIVAVDGTDVASPRDLRRALRDKKAGGSVRLDLVRGRSRQTVVATLVEHESPAMFRLADLEQRLGSPEWRGRLATLPNCFELQSKLKELEVKMKELEKKLQK